MLRHDYRVYPAVMPKHVLQGKPVLSTDFGESAVEHGVQGHQHITDLLQLNQWVLPQSQGELTVSRVSVDQELPPLISAQLMIENLSDNLLTGTSVNDDRVPALAQVIYDPRPVTYQRQDEYHLKRVLVGEPREHHRQRVHEAARLRRKKQDALLFLDRAHGLYLRRERSSD
jgi:hypothetical protein